MTARLLALLVVAVACSDLPPIADDICGNGQVDADEDCDGAAGSGQDCGAPGTANACRYVCEAAACPAGFACGVDGRCRAPAGTFRAPSGRVAFGASQLAAGDIDGDGFADLVGTNENALVVGFGSATGLVDVDSQSIDEPDGATTFGDLDGDGHLDVVFPTDDGVFGFVASGRGFEPLPFPFVDLHIGSGSQSVVLPPAPTDPTGAVRVFVVRPDQGSATAATAGTPLVIANAGALFFVQPHAGLAGCFDGGIATVGSAQGCALADPADADFTTLLGDHLARARTGFVAALDGSGNPLLTGDGRLVAASPAGSPADDPTDELALARAGSDEVRVFSAAGSDRDNATVPAIVPALMERVPLDAKASVGDAGELLFGDFDDDGCVDLLIPTTAGLQIAFGTKAGSACDGQLGSAQLQHPFSTTQADLAPLAVVDLDGDGRDDVVFGTHYALGTCSGSGTGPACGWTLVDAPTRPPRAWTDAVVADVDHDGLPDLAGRVAGETGVDVELGTGAFPLIDHAGLATELPVRFVDRGDFDGDRSDDIVAIVGAGAAGGAADRVVVSYGAAFGQPGPFVDMGAFGVSLSMSPASIIFDPFDADAIADLVVVYASAGDVEIAALHGSTTRRLLGPLLFQRQVGGGSDDTIDIPIAAVVGEFGSAVAPGVMALAIPTSLGGPGSGSDHGPDVFVAIDHGSDAFSVVPDCLALGLPRGDSDGICNGAQPPADVSFDFTDASYATARVAGTPAILLGVDASDRGGDFGSATLFVFDTSHGFDGAPTASRVGSAAGVAESHALSVADLDGDGTDDAIVELARPSQGTGEAGSGHELYAVWGPAYAASADAPSITGCTGAVALQADPDPQLELAAICGGTVTVFHLDIASRAWTGAPAFDAPDAIALVAGDFDGDGVTDLAVVHADTLEVEVVAQCPARDSSCAAP